MVIRFGIIIKIWVSKYHFIAHHRGEKGRIYSLNCAPRKEFWNLLSSMSSWNRLEMPRVIGSTDQAKNGSRAHGIVKGEGMNFSLYFAEIHFLTSFFALFLVLAVATLTFRAGCTLLYGSRTTSVRANRLSSKSQGWYHRGSGRFVLQYPLDFSHHCGIKLRDELQKLNLKKYYITVLF